MKTSTQSKKNIGLEKGQRTKAVIALLLAIGIAVMDMNIANLALPTISRALNIPQSQTIWIVNAYLIIIIATLIPLSAVAEKIGFKRAFRIGVVLFVTGAIFCASANSLSTLIIGRIIQGLGGATLTSLFGGLMRHIYPPKELASGISINAMIVGITAVLSPTFGAFIISIASWRWIFSFTIPLCIIALIFSTYLPRVERNKKAFDYLGAVLNMVTFGTLITALNLLTEQTLLALFLFLIAISSGIYMIRRANLQTQPLVPVDLFKINTFKFAIIISALTFSSAMMTMLSFPFFFENIVGIPISQVGLLFTAWPIGSTVMARPSARLSNKYPASILAAIGSSLMCMGILSILFIPLTSPLVFYAACMFIAGMGFGFFQTPNNKAILLSTPLSRSNATGGVQSTTRIFGQSIGAATISVIFFFIHEQGAYFGLIAGASVAFLATLINLIRYKIGMDAKVI